MDFEGQDFGAYELTMGAVDFDAPQGAKESGDAGITSNVLRRSLKAKSLAMLRRQRLSEALIELPKPGEVLHAISNARYESFTWVPVLIAMLGGKTNSFHASTWVMSIQNIHELYRIGRQGKLGDEVGIVFGRHFKRSKPAQYGTFCEAARRLGWRHHAFFNHSKIVTLDNGRDFLTLTGSANWTGNPRVEQYTLTNDKSIWEFHRKWIKEILSRGDAKKSD